MWLVFLERCSLSALVALAAIGSLYLTRAAAEELSHEATAITAVWASTGEDKVTRAELRSTKGRNVTSSTWDGRRITVFGARNEIVSFNLVLEAGERRAEALSLVFEPLSGPGGYRIETGDQSTREWGYTGKNVELFFVRYLEIKGLSTLSFNYWHAEDDERNVPGRLQRPHDESGNGQGTWSDRPDHNAGYPDIAVPLALHTPFDIPARANQSIWADIYVPKDAPSGLYVGNVVVAKGGIAVRKIPVELRVRDFTLPDKPSAKTMLFINDSNINRRFLGTKEPNGTAAAQVSQTIVDRYFQMAHRHKISLIDDYESPDKLASTWGDRLSGQLFTPGRGYDGPGVGVGNNVYSIGTYTTWPWQNAGRTEFGAAADRWVRFLDGQSFAKDTDYFLYLLDESKDYARMEQWAVWADNNPGPGKRLRTFATLGLPQALEMTPSLDIIASTPDQSMRGPAPTTADNWQEAYERLRAKPGKSFFLYNGSRPVSGTFAIDDDGVAPRILGWLQFALGIERWFKWEGTYYENIHHNTGETNVFTTAHTFGDFDGVDAAMGQTGDNYDNGNGVLFYPGTDRVFAEESYEFAGPLASLRLKHWRRGIQDHDYLVLASRSDPARVKQILNTLITDALWSGAVTPADAKERRSKNGVGWSTDPQDWESARAELADIIEAAEINSKRTQYVPK